MKKSKKGFTLIELLAVIVILAVLILLALPAVLNMMQRAQRNAFILEANEIISQAETYYTEKQMGGAGTGMCVNLATLYTEKYSNKNFADVGYSGKISFSQNSTTGDVSIKLWLSNGSLYIKELDSITMASLKESDPGLLKTKPTDWDDAGVKTCLP